jgi:predicted RND superfamily exporter protein
MARKQKKKRGGKIVAGGVIGLLLVFFFNGELDLNLLNPGGNDINNSEVVESVEEPNEEIATSEEIVIKIEGNDIYLNDELIEMDMLIDKLGETETITLQASDSKQVTYDEVKTLLNTHDIIIIEE